MDDDRIVAQAQEPAPMTYSTALAAFTQGWEGLRLVPYQDGAGYWTVGYGCRMQDGDPHDPITADEAEALFDTHMLYTADRVTALMSDPDTGKMYRPLTQQQFDCLCDFAYNLGPGQLAGSTLRKRIIGGYLDEVPDLLLQWNKRFDPPTNAYVVDAGLAKRRAAERAMWLYSDYSRRP